MKKKLIVILLIIMLFNMLYIQPVYAQTSLIESIKQKASELALIKLAVATGVSAITSYNTAKSLVNDMVSSAPDIFNGFKDSVVDSANRLKFALVASDVVWQSTKSFVSSLNKPINTPIEYIPQSVESFATVSGLGDIDFSYTTTSSLIKLSLKIDGTVFIKDSQNSYGNGYEYFLQTTSQTYPNYRGFDAIQEYIDQGLTTFRIYPFYRTIDGVVSHVSSQIVFNYNPTTGILTTPASGVYSKQITSPIVTYEYMLDGQVFNPDGTITLDPRSISPDDDFTNDKVGDTPKRLVGFPLPWSELPSVSEGVINDGIDLGELSNAQLEAIDLTLDALLEQVDTLSTDLVRTEDLLQEALLNPPFDSTGVIPAIESIGNIITNAFNPPTISIDFSPLQNFNILTSKFPFSLPWDLRNTFQIFLDTPEAPIFNIPFKFGGILENVELDFTLFDPIIGLFRWLLIIAFTLGLIYLSTIYL